MATERRYVLDGETVSRNAVRQVLGAARLDGVMSALLNHRPTAVKCPHCGTTQADIEATGLTGCPLCYAVHEKYILERFGAAES